MIKSNIILLYAVFLFLEILARIYNRMKYRQDEGERETFPAPHARNGSKDFSSFSLLSSPLLSRESLTVCPRLALNSLFFSFSTGV
jgi:hypothetical protein